ATVAVFADEVHELAVVIADRSEGRERAFYDPHAAAEAAWQRAQELAAVGAGRTRPEAAGGGGGGPSGGAARGAGRAGGTRPAAQPVAVPARPSSTLPRAVRIDGTPRRETATAARGASASESRGESSPPPAAAPPEVVPAPVAVAPSGAELAPAVAVATRA